MKNIHMICNAHLDPVWLWQREEGIGEALSTFRIAADFCENYDGFVFNHNEAVLYEWVEEFEPVLFEKIQKLVKKGKWHIMGGWYLQPDCTMPSGESFIRQITYGNKYFMDKFGVKPTTAINFDSFGHTRGLVQIMKKSGYDSYLFCRPAVGRIDLPNNFKWVGFDGSEVIGNRGYRHYLSGKGKAYTKVDSFIEKYPNEDLALVLWGIGNHGGGPSKEDLEILQEYKEKNKDVNIMHSTPENYFKELNKSDKKLKKVEKSLYPFAVGCYTSQIRIKQKHRLLENELYMTEKMISNAAINGVMKYKTKKLIEAQKDLMFNQFHDILPGSSIQVVEEDALRQLDHGLEITNKLKSKAFYNLLKGEEKGEDKVLPIFAFNPHPYEIEGIFECEYMNEFITSKVYSVPTVKQDGKEIPSQDERELSGLHALDWRKRVIFKAKLKPSSLNRFDLTLEQASYKKTYARKQYTKDGYVRIKTNDLDIKINKTTGLVDAYKVDGVNYLKKDAFRFGIFNDDSDAWSMENTKINDQLDSFRLMTTAEAKDFGCITKKKFDAVRVVEDGDVRTVIEAYFKYNDSAIIMTYIIPKIGKDVDINVRVYWNEKEKMLKLLFPTNMSRGICLGQTANGTEKLFTDGTENTSQKWTGVFDGNKNSAFGIIDDGIYGSNYEKGILKMSLVRSPGYSAHPKGVTPMMIADRCYPRVDQGERIYSFKILAGEKQEILDNIDRKALEFNEKPMVVTAYPSGEKIKTKKSIQLSNSNVLLQAFKETMDKNGYTIRLYNPSENEQKTDLKSGLLGIDKTIKLSKYEIKTFVVKNNKIVETDLLER